jgi:S-adenosylmethionine:tRNA ribosyltransferase-isomerase
MKTFDKLLKKYDYKFPTELIAQSPASPRDSAKLLVYDRKTKQTNFDTFKNIGKYLPKNSVLVFNETKVIPARITVTKETGGKAKLLYISTNKQTVRVMSDRKLPLGVKLYIAKKLYFTVIGQSEKFYLLSPSFKSDKLFSVLEKYGSTPLPPYIKKTPLSEKKLQEQYQTVFAKTRGSVAAPTASLHFTKKLIEKIKRQGFEVHFVTLHVNLGTFAPLTEENVADGKLHREYFEIDKKTAHSLNTAKAAGKPIIGVGTTVLRTLESATKNGKLKNLSGTTDLFIQEGYSFKFVNGIMTNFHVPRSSLLMLVSAFVGRDTMFKVYRKAISKKFRLFSFGDGMLIS